MPQQLSLTQRVRQLLKKGIGHHQAGRMERAEACYQRALGLDSQCPQTLLLLGLLAQQEGMYQQSIHWIEKSLVLNPNDPDTLRNLAESYFGLGDFQTASDWYRRLVKLGPQSAEAHHRLGKTEERLGDWDAATASYLQALALKPDSPAVLESLAGLQTKQGDHAKTVESCRRALALDPNRHESLVQMGTALVELEDYEAAVEAFRRALLLKPDSAPALAGLGYFFEHKGDIDSATDSYLNALKFNPASGLAWIRLGTARLLQGDLEEAGRCFREVQKLEPDSAEALAFLGLIHLKQGNFRAGLAEYESRWGTSYGLRFRRRFTQPLWHGEPVKGARILLHAEQGMGDTLQFIRYVPLVAARGVKVVLEVQPRLHRLLAHTRGAESVICRDAPLPEFDWQCPLLSLPRALGTEVDSIPANVPYICPDPIQVEAWNRRLPARSVRIGLAWAGNPLHPHERWRSIPLEQLAPLTQLEGATFYSLQMGAAAGQLKRMGYGLRIVDLQNEQNDFADTAAIVANLDLVISIDTSVAHLVGAMGKPVWILLCKSSDWRWLLDREDSPWYPTARLFRQSRLGNWQDVLAQVDAGLRQLVARTDRGCAPELIHVNPSQSAAPNSVSAF